MLTLAHPKPRLAAALEAAVRGLGVDEVPDLELQRSRNPAHGDYASPVAMKLARVLRRPPPEIAAEIAARVELEEATAEAVAGYVNFRFRLDWLRVLVGAVAEEPTYGSSEGGGGLRVQVEFGSINPTGPLHIGHGRGIVLGDSLCRLLTFTGHEVQREYYVNDQNTQARRFGASVLARMRGEEPPEGGYTGDYVTELAEQARRDLPGVEDFPDAEAEPQVRRYAIERMVERLRTGLERIDVEYDEWYRESSLWEQGLPQAAIERLRERGQVRTGEGALWFSPEVPGWEEQDEDRVIIRSDGEPTYFASDLGYLVSKFEVRGFQREVEVWGADHHGYVPRMKSAMAALGYDPEDLVVILMQLVSLKTGRMSKRQGRFVTLDDLVEQVGKDAVRYFYLLRSPDVAMEFDLDLAVSEGNENPVYYAQYAHARLCNVEPHAAQVHGSALPRDADLSLLTAPAELAVAQTLAYWPDVVEMAARLLEPHRLPYYVHELADRVHAFYHTGNDDPALRVVVDDPALTRARLELCRAARNTLRTALGLMGVSAPERM
ncbi:MAG: arginine--tRNA ligase [bacterium]|nr:arginine--tRNA ligase [bacterium]